MEPRIVPWLRVISPVSLVTVTWFQFSLLYTNSFNLYAWRYCLHSTAIVNQEVISLLLVIWDRHGKRFCTKLWQRNVLIAGDSLLQLDYICFGSNKCIGKWIVLEKSIGKGEYVFQTTHHLLLSTGAFIRMPSQVTVYECQYSSTQLINDTIQQLNTMTPLVRARGLWWILLYVAILRDGAWLCK